MNYSDSTLVHEATTPWVESVNNTQFTACVTRAGRNDYPSDSFATVDWVAYQGHRLGEWQARNGSQDGGLGLAVKRSPLPR